jgi:uncharacterized protein YehS (DUF1456 family)
VINNDILRRVRFIFDLKDSKMIHLFELGGGATNRSEISNWLKREEDSDYIACTDLQMATFLNGFIVFKRGKKDGPQPVPESKLDNNIVLVKLKIALNLKADEMLALLGLAGLLISKHELSAFFRKRDHKHFRECKDQVLRNFLQGLQAKYADSDKEAPVFEWKTPGET